MPRKTSASVIGAATSCPSRWPPARAGPSGWPTPSAGSKRAAPKRPSRSPPHVAHGRAKPSAAWKKTTASRCRPTPTTRPTGSVASTSAAGSSVARRSRSSHPRRRRGKINTTDPDSRNVKTPRGWVQGYNAQAVDDRGPDRHRRRADELLGGLRADSGRPSTPRGASWSPPASTDDARRRARRRRLLAPGPDASARRRRHHGPHPARRQQAQRDPARAGTAASTRSCAASLATPAGAALYRRRSGMIEPVFADTKFNRKIDRF